MKRCFAIVVLPKPDGEQISCIGLRPLATESISVAAVCISVQTMLVCTSYGKIMAPFSYLRATARQFSVMPLTFALR